MQHVFDELREDLARFVEQREALTLVLWAKAPSDVLYAFKLLEAMDDASARDVFLLFAEECFDAVRYVDAIVTACDMDIDSGNAGIRAGAGGEGATEWESLPRVCFDDTRRPLERLRPLVEHLRRYYPDPAHRIVLALVPTGRGEPSAYAEVARSLIPWDGYQPWMAGVRIVLVDWQDRTSFVDTVIERDALATLVRPIDFGPDALTEAVAERAADSSAPPADRVAALVQVAALDHAWKRYDEAIAKYGVAFRYYLAERAWPMVAVTLLFAGHSLEQLGRREEARERYRQALEQAIANDVKQVMLNALMALGGLHEGEEDWSAGAEYWEGAAFTAKALNNFFALVDSTRHAGICRVALDEVDRALELWDAGKTVATQVGYWDGAVTLLGYLIELERREGRDDARRAHEQELEAARREQAHQAQEVRAANAAMSEAVSA
ncbi:MAG: hypothetical protein KF729_37235 [Sandaracinaceae bacterium]|nr:hypothetical protein [Sandaracinaceae bacterium]